MTRTKVEFTTDKGVIPVGKILDEKELNTYFTTEEIEEFKKNKYLEEIIVPNIEVKSVEVKSKKAKTITILHINEMSDEQLEEYAQELGIDTTAFEDSDEVYDAILGFDYASLKVGPLKKYAQIIGANIEGKTAKDDYIAAIVEILDTEPENKEE
ncbi:hypothetical protein [Aliarcobacter butzleri]|uniref:hypothetical protein n=1 Tax=Aliarcobacter butzleri TaxID=28197 RepID=UPI003AF8C627